MARWRRNTFFAVEYISRKVIYFAPILDVLVEMDDSLTINSFDQIRGFLS